MLLLTLELCDQYPSSVCTQQAKVVKWSEDETRCLFCDGGSLQAIRIKGETVSWAICIEGETVSWVIHIEGGDCFTGHMH